jgi:hypothetical protein
MSLESSTVPMISEREIVSSNQKTTGIRGFPTGCFAYADDELSGKLVFSGARRVSIGLSKSSSIHLSVKYLWLLVGNWAPLCLAIRQGLQISAPPP